MRLRVPFSILLALLILAAPFSAGSAPLTTPPGFNVHMIVEQNKHVVWRGGAPRQDTVRALAAAAKARGVTVTMIDLRHPANSDDESGKEGRLSPSSERKMADSLGMRYESLSALDGAFVERMDEALKKGDVYIHCMYGVNRTGFAVARYATARNLKVDRKGLGTRDWAQGEAFQRRSATPLPLPR